MDKKMNINEETTYKNAKKDWMAYQLIQYLGEIISKNNPDSVVKSLDTNISNATGKQFNAINKQNDYAENYKKEFSKLYPKIESLAKSIYNKL